MASKNVSQFAAGTTVSPEKTMMEIRALLGKHGAQRIQTSEDIDHVQIGFALKNRVIRFRIELPRPEDPAFRPRYRQRVKGHVLWEAEIRRRWRVCLLIIKSKLEAVASNAQLFDVELLPYFVMPDGKTVAEHINTQKLDLLYAGKTQLLIGDGSVHSSN